MKRLACIILLAAAASALGGETRSPSQAIAPFVDDMTFLVIRIDVPAIKPAEVVRRLEQMLGPNAPADRHELSDIHAKFVRAGGRELFLLFNLADGPGEPVVVVPLAANADKTALRQLIVKGNVRAEEKAGTLVIGPEKALTSALNRQPKAVADLAKAFAAVEKSAAQFVFLPPRPFFRAQEELAPNLPPDLGGGPVTAITRGFQWAAVGADLTPTLHLKATAQASGADAAAELGKLADRALAKLVQTVQRDAPAVAQVLPLLKPKVEGDRVVLALDARAIDSVLTPAISKVRLAAMRAQSTNNLKQIALAMHNYHDTFKSFPPPTNLDKQEKPLLSWRVHILPFIEGDALYRQFKLDEPWDSEHNKKLIPQMPKVFQSPLAKNVAAGKTVYLAASGPGMVFEGPQGMQIQKITDGTSNTIMIVEANDAGAVTWTKPDDYKPQKKDPAASLRRQEMKGFHAAFADGSVRFIGSMVDADVLWAALTCAGNELFDQEKLNPK